MWAGSWACSAKGEGRSKSISSCPKASQRSWRGTYGQDTKTPSPDFSMEMGNRRHKCTWPSTHCLELTAHSLSTRAVLSNSTVPVQGPQN